MNSLGETKGTDRTSGTRGMADYRSEAVRRENAAVNSQNEAVGLGNERETLAVCTPPAPEPSAKRPGS